MRNNVWIAKFAGIFVIFAIVLMIVTAFTGCGAPADESAKASNYEWIDTARRFDRVIAVLPNGTVIDDDVEAWTDFEESDQIQVTINGDTYLFHSSNVVLIKER